jgi:SOS-response transcriptional repressor LexA
MAELTEREREILTLIARSIDANGYQPSYREIAAHFGWTGLGWLQYLARRIARKGHAQVIGARAWSFDWKSYLKEQKHDAARTDGSRTRRVPRRHVRRERRA